MRAGRATRESWCTNPMVSTRTAPTRGECLRGGLCNVAGAVLSSAGVTQGGGGAQESATILLGKARIANAKKHQNAESTGKGYSTTHARLLMFMCVGDLPR